MAPASVAKVPRAAELTVRDITFSPQRSAPGESVVFKYSLWNRGRRNADSTRERTFLSRDKRVDGKDVSLPVIHRSRPLPAGRARRNSFRQPLPVSLPGGRYHVIVCADAKRQQRERNERNNCATAKKRLSVARLGSGVVGPSGGVTVLPDTAMIAFAPGAFGTETPVDVGRTQDPGIGTLFEDAQTMLRATGRPVHEVQVRVGREQPQNDAVLSLAVPADFRAAVPPGSEIRVLLLNVWDDETERLDSLELADERFPPDAETVSVRVPSYFFSNADQPDGRFRLVAVLTTTPTAPSRHTRLTAAADDGGAKCKGVPLGPPLPGELVVTSPYGTRDSGFHSGVDYRAQVPTPVLAVNDGKIIEIVNSKNGGYRIVIELIDGSRVAYMHLTPGSQLVNPMTKSPTNEGEPFKVGDVVLKGDALALSGKSGTKDPHLHIEYARNGKLFEGGRRDPAPCFNATVPGSITVEDNGSAKDDAFEVWINGDLVCRTEIGQENACDIAALRPGTVDLEIIATVAPDDVGTFMITLRDGLAFTDGSTSDSGEIPEGGKKTYQVLVPG